MSTTTTTQPAASPAKPTFYINASALKISSCFRRFIWTVCHGYSDKSTSIDIVFGWGFHKFAQILDEKADPATGAYEHLIPEAMAAAISYFDSTTNIHVKYHKKYLTKEYLVKCCMDYALVYKKAEQKLYKITRAASGKTLTELQFVVPCYSCDEFDLLFAGTIDRIVQYNNGGHYVLRDYKTTSVFNEDEYLENYILSPQLYFYVYIIKQLANMCETLGEVDNIYSQIVSRPLSCIIDGVFLKGKDKECVFKSSRPFTFKDHQMERFEKQLTSVVDRLIGTLQSVVALSKGKNISFEQALDETLIDYAPNEGMLNGACQTVYGMCKYAIPCGMPDDAGTRGMLLNNFTKKPYNPVEVDV